MRENGSDWRALYFARDKADKRPPLEQCKELSVHLEKTGFEVRVMGSDTNHLIFYGKELNNA